MPAAKECRECLRELPLSSFHKHKLLKDGVRNICKDCAKARAKNYYYGNREKKLKYAASRRASPDQKKKNSDYHKEYRKRDGYKRGQRERTRRYNSKPGSYVKVCARTALNNAVQQGVIEKPSYCSRCGKNSHLIEGHHKDYTKALDVDWLCPSCHGEEHTSGRN